MSVSTATYERVAMEDDGEKWELVCGRLRRKPVTTYQHNRIVTLLLRALLRQLPFDQYEPRANSARTGRSDSSLFVPDVLVVPVAAVAALRHSRDLEVYAGPLPFVAEGVVAFDG